MQPGAIKLNSPELCVLLMQCCWTALPFFFIVVWMLKSKAQSWIHISGGPSFRETTKFGQFLFVFTPCQGIFWGEGRCSLTFSPPTPTSTTPQWAPTGRPHSLSLINKEETDYDMQEKFLVLKVARLIAKVSHCSIRILWIMFHFLASSL